jgi:hypothetical protein
VRLGWEFSTANRVCNVSWNQASLRQGIFMWQRVE